MPAHQWEVTGPGGLLGSWSRLALWVREVLRSRQSGTG